MICILLTLLVAGSVSGAPLRTVGVLKFDSLRTAPGYTLFAPLGSNITYLVDNEGRTVRTWQSSYWPGQTVMLLPDGSLLRAGSPGGDYPMSQGGAGGVLERYSWYGELLWRYVCHSDTHRAHHDVEWLPNGNVLALVWEKHDVPYVLARGRNPERLVENQFWSERIVEIRPVGTDSGEVVWSWSVMDHIVQDYAPSLPDYGVVHEHPERVNINAGGARADWLHLNSIRYHAGRDEIMVSVRNTNEVWIISRRTGNIVYRWGNPATYGRGLQESQTLYGQHDARWIQNGVPGAGNVLVFNNGYLRPPVGMASYSSIEELVLPRKDDGSYVLEGGQPYGPAVAVSYVPRYDVTTFFAPNLGGAVRLGNGNTLVTLGPSGHILELTPEGDTAWQYASPISTSGAVMQGQQPSVPMIFKAYKYAPDFPGFAGRELQPGSVVEMYNVSSVDTEKSYVNIRWQFVLMPDDSRRVWIRLEQPAHVTLHGYDAGGRERGVVVDAWLEAGTHLVEVAADIVGMK